MLWIICASLWKIVQMGQLFFVSRPTVGLKSNALLAHQLKMWTSFSFASLKALELYGCAASTVFLSFSEEQGSTFQTRGFLHSKPSCCLQKLRVDFCSRLMANPGLVIFFHNLSFSIVMCLCALACAEQLWLDFQTFFRHFDKFFGAVHAWVQSVSPCDAFHLPFLDTC